MSAATDPFVHPALFYRTDEEYLAGLVPFVLDGLRIGEPVAAALPTERLGLLESALGTEAAEVTLIDMTEAGRNPGRIIPGVLRAFADRHRRTHVRIIGEPIWAGRSDSEYPACVQHEALINTAFRSRMVTIVCPYDVRRLESHVVADALATHPLIWEAGHEQVSLRYAPDAVVARYNLPLDGTGGAASWTVRSAADLSGARRFAAAEADQAGLSRDRISDLELVVSELATNSLQHAAGACSLSIWAEADHVICESRDLGQIEDPLAGRRPPLDGQPHGRGLLLVNHLADLVRVHTTPDGTTVRAYFRLAGSDRPGPR
ncbi:MULTISPECIES: sensor histidine kinase [Nocardioides]|uniref:Anti-sigma factor RsbA family regulatory protein n=1 Tax=Nocardioides vastitatis TaxID=2568655 RepID=A0ABW0ZCU9_9ACTN|nr:sensor histidine kinase [Nocardioides sp.]THJ13132.1 sensor histidine kinase [Nocardioides sp.]